MQQMGIWIPNSKQREKKLLTFSISEIETANRSINSILKTNKKLKCIITLFQPWTTSSSSLYLRCYSKSIKIWNPLTDRFLVDPITNNPWTGIRETTLLPSSWSLLINYWWRDIKRNEKQENTVRSSERQERRRQTNNIFYFFFFLMTIKIGHIRWHISCLTRHLMEGY